MSTSNIILPSNPVERQGGMEETSEQVIVPQKIGFFDLAGELRNRVYNNVLEDLPVLMPLMTFTKQAGLAFASVQAFRELIPLILPRTEIQLETTKALWALEEILYHFESVGTAQHLVRSLNLSDYGELASSSSRASDLVLFCHRMQSLEELTVNIRPVHLQGQVTIGPPSTNNVPAQIDGLNRRYLFDFLLLLPQLKKFKLTFVKMDGDEGEDENYDREGYEDDEYYHGEGGGDTPEDHVRYIFNDLGNWILTTFEMIVGQGNVEKRRVPSHLGWSFEVAN